MIRFVLTAIAQLIANAVALLVANYFLDDMELNASGFITAVVIFTIAEVLLLPFFRQMAIDQGARPRREHGAGGGARRR